MSYSPDYWFRHAALVVERTGKTIKEVMDDELEDVIE